MSNPKNFNHVTHDDTTLAKGQVESKKNKFDRSPKSVEKFYDESLIPTYKFTGAPEEYCKKLTYSELRALKWFIDFFANNEKMECSHQYLANAWGISTGHAKRILDRFKKEGIIASFYRHKKTSLYKLSPALNSWSIRKAIQHLFPVLACLAVFTFSAAGHFQKEYVLETTKYVNKRALYRNNKRMSSSETFQFSLKSEVGGRRALSSTPEVCPEMIAWMRDSSHHEALCLEHKKTYNIPEDPFYVAFRKRTKEKIPAKVNKVKEERKGWTEIVYGTQTGPQSRWVRDQSDTGPLRFRDICKQGPIDEQDRLLDKQRWKNWAQQGRVTSENLDRVPSSYERYGLLNALMAHKRKKD